jgi:hypothetical protein
MPDYESSMTPIWKPVTYGEELFLNLYEEFGSRMRIDGPDGAALDFLVNSPAFQASTRLSATTEVFLRCVRSAIEFHGREPHAVAQKFARAAQTELDLPPRLSQNLKFAERLKQVGRIAFEAKRNKVVEKTATRDEPNYCYLCGASFAITGGLTRSIEHVWPLSLGGETVEQNLVLACSDCNSKRGRMLTWAWGPVHSTYYTYSSNNPTSPPTDLRLSLALARLLKAAAPTRNRRNPLTLKDAAQSVRPAIQNLDVHKDRPYVYFELLQLI